MKKPPQHVIDAVTKEFASKGLLIEAGWASYKIYVLPPDAPQVQIDECRLAFFAGAQHLFGSIMSILDPDGEPTAADLRKMDLINSELEKFAREFELRVQTPKGMA